ncbi:nucleoside hydrolase [Jiangella anatolica]|uniref:Nucleoside hydrolase n=1 Tax=Jiangella anatolica TaxID=2670374 RepID=A0A2W2BHC8_9ACTN|nr:nucleoside hydrolase [Jiangella anatolica]PZF84690.1 nucleoside hydrolase [Jiangella anatolica]
MTYDSSAARSTFALDTDIGTDVDDLLALAMALGSPELEVAAVTTVYGDVELRARIVAKVFAAAGRAAPPIAPGEPETLSGRPVWWPGHEGSTIADLGEQVYAGGRDAAGELAASATVVAIGPLTNVAVALRRPDRETERVVMMGGEFRAGVVEHNVRCDVTAAAEVFASGLDLLAVGLDQTQRVRLGRAELDAISARGAFGGLIGAEMRRFWAFAGQDHNVPHDPIAVLTLARPDLFATERGTITVETDGDGAGTTRFASDPAGPHEVVVDLDVPRVTEEIVHRILAAARPAATTA